MEIEKVEKLAKRIDRAISKNKTPEIDLAREELTLMHCDCSDGLKKFVDYLLNKCNRKPEIIKVNDHWKF